MAKEWTDDEVKAEIAEAIAIVREDRFEAYVRSRTNASTDQNPPTGSPPAPNGNPATPPKKKGLFWGEQE
jgi:hypothetical protein